MPRLSQKSRDVIKWVAVLALLLVAYSFVAHNDSEYLKEYMAEHAHDCPAKNKVIAVYVLPDEVRDCMPEDELTTAVLKLSNGKIACDKHTTITESQQLAKLKLAYPIKKSEGIKQ